MPTFFKPKALFKIFLVSLWALVIIGYPSCTINDWEDHYQTYPETVNIRLWDALQEDQDYSEFVKYIKAYKLDSLFLKKQSYTLFVPRNEAFSALEEVDTSKLMNRILRNHISSTLFQVRNVENYQKLQNLTGKFSLVGNTPNGFSYDEVAINSFSPLYLDGMFYGLDSIAFPKPNLYEFTELFSTVIKEYLDLRDSVYLDKSLSKPLGFDENGNTIYDSIFETVNRFERDFFPVKQEFRDRSATFVLFTQEQYNNALDEVAQNLGGAFSTYEDLPEIWEFDILLPKLLEGSLFSGMLEYTQFTDTMISITGDSVFLDPFNIDPESRFLCSNGVTFTYKEFHVPTELYEGTLIIEGEDLLDSLGPTTFAWKEEVFIEGATYVPVKGSATEASGNYLVSSTFDRNFPGPWSLSVTFKNVFPRQYVLNWRAGFRPSGNYSVYVNDVLLEYVDRFGRTLTEFDTYELRGALTSVTGDRLIPDGNFNTRDYYVNNLTEFGDVTVKIVYNGPGSQSSNGFVLDYLSLTPAAK